MQYKCSKCGKDNEDNTMFVEGGIGYLFCKECADILDHLPTGNRINNFISSGKETWVEENIRKVRERRKRGEKMW